MAENENMVAKPPGRLADTERTVIDQAGRLVIPARFRKALGIRGRRELVVALEGDTIRLRTIDTALNRLQSLAGRKRRGGGSVVDAFLADRHEDDAEA